MWGGAETARRVRGGPGRVTRLLAGTCPLGRSPRSSSEALLIDSPHQDTLVWIARRARPSFDSILAAKQPTNLIDTNIVPVSVLRWPSNARDQQRGETGARLALHLSRRCGAEPRQQG